MQIHDDHDTHVYTVYSYIFPKVLHNMSLALPSCLWQVHVMVVYTTVSPPLRHTCCQNFQANQSEADDLWLELCCLWWRLSFRQNHGPVEGSMHTSVVAADNTERMVPEADVTGCHGVISWRLSLLRHTGGLSWQRPGFPSFQWKDWTSQWC